MNTESKPTRKLATQADAVLYFIQQLDIDMVDKILEDDRTYQDVEKNIFMRELSLVFSKFLEAGDTFLRQYEGRCDSKVCNYNCSGYTFMGNKSNYFVDLIIDIKDGVVQDIYDCSTFKNLEIVPGKLSLRKLDLM